MRKYGTDKPDLRNPIEMQNVTEAFRGSGFKIFAGMLAKEPKAEVWAIPAPSGGNRAFCDRMNAWAQGEGQPGLGYIFWREGEEGGAGPARQEHRARSAPSRLPISSASASATRCSSSPASRSTFVQIRRAGAHQGRRRAGV